MFLNELALSFLKGLAIFFLKQYLNNYKVKFKLKKNMENRIQINHKKGAVLKYVYSRKFVELLFPNFDINKKSEIKIGSRIVVDGTEMEIVDFKLFLFDEKQKIESNLGLSLYSDDNTHNLSYDISILIIVNDIAT